MCNGNEQHSNRGFVVAVHAFLTLFSSPTAATNGLASCWSASSLALASAADQGRSSALSSPCS